MPRVSVGLPVFNAERYLESALTSVREQSYSDFEVVISDNGSTDGTQDICRAYADSDERFRYFRHPENRGAAWNHNFVVHSSRGELFRWYSYDDLMAPRLLEACVAALDAHPDAVLAWPSTTVIDGEGNFVEAYRTDLPWQGNSPSERLRDLLGHPANDTLLSWCYPVYGLVRMSTLRSTRLLQPYNSADQVLLVELALRGAWVHVPERLFFSRRHEQSSVGQHTAEQIARWFDPTASGPPPMVFAQLFRGFTSAVLASPMTTSERARCLAVLTSWLRRERNGRVILGEVKRRLTYYTARRRTGR